MAATSHAPLPLHCDPIVCNVRPCRAQDTKSIDAIIRKVWPGEPAWRNSNYWTKQFTKPNSERFGYVIEDNDVVFGCALYMWTKPLKKQSNCIFKWHQADFTTTSFRWSQGYTTNADCDMGHLCNDNKNLKENWHKLETHCVHITDVAIHPHKRRNGFGTRLMQSMISSFPTSTRFALEVKCSNKCAIRCYEKCGFIIKSQMHNYYEREPGYKMVLVSKRVDKCKYCHKSSDEARTKLRLCSRCQITLYCNKRCQKRDWRTHQKYCRFSNKRCSDE